jgi:hypothetical protein
MATAAIVFRRSGGGDEGFTELTSGTISALPAYVPMTSEPSWAYFISSGAQGQSATYHSSGGWNNQGFVRITLPTAVDAYAALGSFTLTSPADRLHVGWLIRLGPSLTSNDESAGFKAMIALPEGADPDGDPRAILLWHSSVAEQWDIALGNNIDDQPFAGSPNFTAGFNSTQHESEWLYLECQLCSSGSTPNTHKLWITCDSTGGAHTFNETLISTVTSAQSFRWEQIQLIGSYGGYISGGSGADDYFDIGRIYFSDTYIGPPAGFR